jgi:hypothetical protein
MAESKLMKAQARAKELRSEVRDLSDELEAAQNNPSTLRQFVQVPITTFTALGGSYGYVMLQNLGMMPKRVPVDGIAGAVGQLGLAFFHGPVASVLRDIAIGTTAGASGRVGAQMGYESIDTDQGPAWIKPGQKA